MEQIIEVENASQYFNASGNPYHPWAGDNTPIYIKMDNEFYRVVRQIDEHKVAVRWCDPLGDVD